MAKPSQTGLHKRAPNRKGKQTTSVLPVYRGIDVEKKKSGWPKGKPRKAIDEPPVDKMVKEPERKKSFSELMADRERSIHGGGGMTRP